MESPIVDRKSRDLAAELLRRFISGRVTNDEFEDRCPLTDDPAVHAIWETCWLFYDDHRLHRLDGKNRLDPDLRRQISRWILFLDSDLPYLWPQITLPGRDPRPYVKESRLGRALSILSVHPETAKEFLAAGHYPVWPFLYTRDYKAALANPKRLSGRGRPEMEGATA